MNNNGILVVCEKLYIFKNKEGQQVSIFLLSLNQKYSLVIIKV